MLKLFVVLINISSPLVTLKTMIETSLEIYVAANKPCIGFLNTHFLLFWPDQ